MSKRLYIFAVMLLVLSMVLSACGAAAGQPTATATTETVISEPTDTAEPTTMDEPTDTAEPATGDVTETAEPAADATSTTVALVPTDATATCKADTFGCVTVKPGDPIKIGMGGPMTGDNAAYGLEFRTGCQDCCQ